jgi:hypothetical protein
MDGIVRTFKLSAALPPTRNSTELRASLILNALAPRVLRFDAMRQTARGRRRKAAT